MFRFSDISDLCIKCGKCIPECTIHRVNPDEATSPRWFLDILKGVNEGEIEIDKNLKDIVESFADMEGKNMNNIIKRNE